MKPRYYNCNNFRIWKLKIEASAQNKTFYLQKIVKMLNSANTFKLQINHQKFTVQKRKNNETYKLQMKF